MYGYIAFLLSLSILNIGVIHTNLQKTENENLTYNNPSAEFIIPNQGTTSDYTVYSGVTDSFKYYLTYSNFEKLNFQLKEEVERIKVEEQKKVEEEKKVKEEKKAKEEEERQATLARQKALEQQKAREQTQKETNTSSATAPQGSVNDLIQHWSGVYGIDYNKALSIAQCESGLNPSALSSNGLYAGVYQQHVNYWPNRASAAGVPRASVFDANANIKVSIYMMSTQGMYHWPVCSQR